jgi:hypothetical protein
VLILYNIYTRFNPKPHPICLNHVNFSLCFAFRTYYCRILDFVNFQDFLKKLEIKSEIGPAATLNETLSSKQTQVMNLAEKLLRV